MYFLDFTSWLSDIADEVMGTILAGIRTICFWLCTFIYSLIVDLYNFFDTLCRVRLLNGDITGEIAKRIGLILGLVMFVMVIFSLIKMLIEPDKINDKEMGAGAIIKKVIFVVALLGIQNSGFNLLYDIQNQIIESDMISKLILPYTVGEEDKDKFGNLLSASLMKAFYYKENYTLDGYGMTGVSSDIHDNCQTLTIMFYNQIFDYNKYDLGYMCLNESVQLTAQDNSSVIKEDYIISFNGVFAVIAGGFVVYMVFMYCFKVGIRMIQLAFLEVIAPMAIISHLSPKKDNMLSRWRGVYVSTYIDVFIRIAIINFVVFIICVVFASNAPTDIFNLEAMSNLGFNSGYEKAFFTIIIILSLLTFANKAPDLIKELLPNAGKGLGFGLGMKDIVGLKQGTGMLAGAATGAAIGLLGGAGGIVNGLRKGVSSHESLLGKVWGGFTGTLGGAFGNVGNAAGGMFRGANAGFNAKDIGKAMSSAREKQAKANLARAQKQLSGAHWYDNVGNGVNSFLGRVGGYEILNDEVSSYNDLKSDVEGEDNVKNMLQQANNAYSDFYKRQRDAGVSDEDIQSQNDWIEANYKEKIKREKETAYKELLRKNASFQAKVDMHNRRFGTRYSSGNTWESINETRKAKGAELERQRASRPKR